MTTIKTDDGLTYFTTQSVPDILAALWPNTPAWIELQPSGTLLSLIHVTAIEPDEKPTSVGGDQKTGKVLPCDCTEREHDPECPAAVRSRE